MSYARSPGLGALPAGQTLPVGTRIFAGYSVSGMTVPAGQAPAALQAAMQAGFRGTTVRTGWGGGGDAGGVPSGSLYALVQTAASGITSDTMNSIFANVGQALASRIGGTVRNTHAHVDGAAAGGGSSGGKTGGATDVVGKAITDLFGGSSTPTTDPWASQYPATTTTDTGVPGWAIGVGVAAIVGVGVVAIMMKKPKAVAANGRRRRRRATRRSTRRRATRRSVRRNSARVGCGFCGKQNPASSKFCESCGRQLAAAVIRVGDWECERIAVGIYRKATGATSHSGSTTGPWRCRNVRTGESIILSASVRRPTQAHIDKEVRDSKEYEESEKKRKARLSANRRRGKGPRYSVLGSAFGAPPLSSHTSRKSARKSARKRAGLYIVDRRRTF